MGHVGHPCRLQECQQGVLSAERIPKRKSRVVLEAVAGVVLVVQPPVRPVCVIVNHGRQQRLVKICVKRAADCGGRRVNLDGVQRLAPSVGSRRMDGIEIPARQLGGQIFACAVNARAGQADFG